MYEMYVLAWHIKMEKGEYLTIKEFTIQLLAYEFQPYPYSSIEEVPEKEKYYFEKLQAAGATWLWCSPNAETNSCADLNKNGGVTNAALLNWLAGMESMRKRYNSVFREGKDAYEQIFLQPANLSLASEYYKMFVSPPNIQWALNASDPSVYNHSPATWGNVSMFGPNSGVQSASEGFACNQVVARWGMGDSALVMTPCQVNHFRSR